MKKKNKDISFQDDITKISDIKNRFKTRYFPSKSILINMELMNGDHRTFVTLIGEDNTFSFSGKRYIIDTEKKYYNISAKLFTLDYHEGIALPILRKIPEGAIKDSIEIDHRGVEYSINPATLERLLTAKIAEGVLKGAQLDELFKFFKIVLILTLVISAGHLALFVVKSGMLASVNIPGIN